MSLLFIFVFFLCIAFWFGGGEGGWVGIGIFSILLLSLFAVIEFFIFQFVIFLQSFFPFLFCMDIDFLNFYFPFFYTFDDFFPQLFVFCLFMGFGVSCVVDEVTIERRTHALSHLFKLSLVSVGVSTGSIVVGILVLVYSSGASFPIITGAPVWSGTVVMLFPTLYYLSSVTF